jgi:DnaD/phage-associated family protein
MSSFTIHTRRKKEYTQVSNSFIDNYMADANDAQLKVYLYLLRQTGSDKDGSISALADHFNYTEKDIMRALSYWEKKGILKLEYDSDRHLSGISLLEPVASEQTVRGPMADYPEEEPVSRERKPVRAVACVTPVSSYNKPEYTLDQLAEFKARESTSQLLFIAESYLGKSLSANDVRSLFFISDELHFSFDLIDYLLQYCIDRGKKDFRYIEKVAISWAGAHITTPAQATAHVSRYDKQVYTVMNALGKSSTPTPKETEFIKRWYQVYGFTSDIILEACERTVLATDRHRFEYADKILSSWKNAGVMHKPDIARLDASREKKKPAASPASKNSFNHFQQNDYDFDALEKELLSN